MGTVKEAAIDFRSRTDGLPPLGAMKACWQHYLAGYRRIETPTTGEESVLHFSTPSRCSAPLLFRGLLAFARQCNSNPQVIIQGGAASSGAEFGMHLLLRKQTFARTLLVALVLSSSPKVLLGQGTSGLHYDLRPGDHIIYKQTLTKTVDNKNRLDQKDATGRPLYVHRDYQTEMVWENHVLVLGEEDGNLLVGIQRNLKKAELVRFHLDEKDLTEDRKAGFQEQAFSAPSSAEANLVDASGRAVLPWGMRREWVSKVLFDAHEIMPLPAGPLEVGQTWKVTGFREYTYEVRGREDTSVGACLVSGGGFSARIPASINITRTRFLFCPGNGLVREFLLESNYLNALFAEVQETIRMELVRRRRGESVEDWLAEPELQLAVLNGLLTGGQDEVEPDSLQALLRGTSGEVQKLVLAVLLRQGLPPPSNGGLEDLLESGDPRVRELAERLLSSDESGGARTDNDHNGGRAAHFRPGAYPIRFSLGEGRTWPAIVQVPLDYRADTPVPLVIYLSGNGGPAVEGLLIGEPAFSQTGYLVVYPEANGYWWEDGPAEKFDRLMTEILEKYNVDTTRIYLTGLSNGGTGALYYAAQWPQRFAAVVSAMGAAFGAFDHSDFRNVYPENLAHVPLLFLHGEEDRTIPAELSREAVRRLKHRRFAPLEEHYFKNLGHGVVVGRGDEGRTIEFFRRFVRRPFPRQLRFKMETLQFPRHYWVELLAKKKGVAEVRAEIKEDNTVQIKTKRVERLRLLLRQELFPRQGPIRIVLNGREVFSGWLNPEEQTYNQSLEAARDPLLAYTSAMEFGLQ